MDVCEKFAGGFYGHMLRLLRIVIMISSCRTYFFETKVIFLTVYIFFLVLNSLRCNVKYLEGHTTGVALAADEFLLMDLD